MKKTITFINKTLMFGLLVFGLTMMNYRSVIVNRTFGAYTSCDNCYWEFILNSDAWMIFILSFIVVLSFTLKNYFTRLFLKVISVLFISYYLIDIYIFKFLNQRLYFADIFKYFDWETILETFNRITNNKAYWFILLGTILLSLFLFVHKSMKLNKLEKLLVFIIICPLIYFTVFQKKIDYVNDIYIRNIVEINFKAKESIHYKQQTIQLAEDKISHIENLQCTNNGMNQKRNILLLVVESLSYYQSQLLSGLNDWTPYMDKLAQENIYYTNFFANNFTSLEGRIALLTGEKTFRGVSNFTKRGYGRTGYWNTQRNLPQLLNSYGYSTSFLDGANLNFSNTGDYMNGIGFDYVEGVEYEGYKDKPRFGFNSVSDMDLYDRVIEYIKNEKEPYFSTIITVTTHPPYIVPESRKRSIELSTKYADKAVADFYQKLVDNKFFDNGLLIITSDHRSMTPVGSDELAQFGQKAISRIPLIVIDKNRSFPQVHHQYLQQSDLLNSIEYLVSDEHCYRLDEGNIFSSPPKPSQCIYHSRGDYRERIDVYCDNGSQSATIELNGDNTQIIEGQLNNSKEILDFINYSRIAAGMRHKKYLETN